MGLLSFNLNFSCSFGLPPFARVWIGTGVSGLNFSDGGPFLSAANAKGGEEGGNLEGLMRGLRLTEEEMTLLKGLWWSEKSNGVRSPQARSCSLQSLDLLKGWCKLWEKSGAQ
jgi:hypothetical protein